MEKIKIVEGDTAAVPVGTGTFGSRSIAVGGSALHVAGGKIIDKGKKIAAHLLEVADADVEFDAGEFRVAGTDRKVSFADVARAAYSPHRYPLETLEPGLDETASCDPPVPSRHGAHLPRAEVDRCETGKCGSCWRGRRHQLVIAR
jgi:carbon-monoxide dehydrogenase large subunit